MDNIKITEIEEIKSINDFLILHPMSVRAFLSLTGLTQLKYYTWLNTIQPLPNHVKKHLESIHLNFIAIPSYRQEFVIKK